MATSTFEREIIIGDYDSVKKLYKIMAEDAPAEPLSAHPYTESEREQSDALLRQCLSRSTHGSNLQRL